MVAFCLLISSKIGPLSCLSMIKAFSHLSDILTALLPHPGVSVPCDQAFLMGLLVLFVIKSVVYFTNWLLFFPCFASVLLT